MLARECPHVSSQDGKFGWKADLTFPFGCLIDAQGALDPIGRSGRKNPCAKNGQRQRQEVEQDVRDIGIEHNLQAPTRVKPDYEELQ